MSTILVEGAIMSVIKAYRFPVTIDWRGGHLTRAVAPGKSALDVATPPEFKGGIEGVWSPEELLVAAAGSCYATTLVAIAARWDLTLRNLRVRGVGHVEPREDHRFGFVAVDLDVSVEADADDVPAVEQAARRAEELCLVSLALETPVHVTVAVNAARPEVAALA
jgi:organic hydroperoxide reductase OsmC/OhrA